MICNLTPDLLPAKINTDLQKLNHINYSRHSRGVRLQSPAMAGGEGGGALLKTSARG